MFDIQTNRKGYFMYIKVPFIECIRIQEMRVSYKMAFCSQVTEKVSHTPSYIDPVQV